MKKEIKLKGLRRCQNCKRFSEKKHLKPRFWGWPYVGEKLCIRCRKNQDFIPTLKTF